MPAPSVTLPRWSTFIQKIAMESIIEQQRKLHEERERLEDAIVKERALKKATVSCLSSVVPLSPDTLNNEHHSSWDIIMLLVTAGTRSYQQ